MKRTLGIIMLTGLLLFGSIAVSYAGPWPVTGSDSTSTEPVETTALADE